MVSSYTHALSFLYTHILYTNTITYACTLSFMIHSAGSPSACYYWFLFLVIHSLPCTLLIFFYLNASCLVQNNDCAGRNDASACMAAPMTGMTDPLNWIHVSDLLCAALLALTFSSPAYFVMSHTRTVCFTITISHGPMSVKFEPKLPFYTML